MTADDPFAHLHDEEFAGRFDTETGHADMIVMAGRTRIPLDGNWHFTQDLFDEGLRQDWFADGAEPPQAWTMPRDYDGSGAASISVPSCWTMSTPERRFFEGSAWYARSFTWPKAMHGERMFLRVGAANYVARVFLNGQFLALHRGGSTPFFVELTETLDGGANRLMIQVDNRRTADRVPMQRIDWFNHGGLYREVDLVPLPRVFIRDLFVRLHREGIAVDVGLCDAASGDVRVEISELGIDAAIAVVGGRGGIVIDADPELWSPDYPRLYDVVVRYAGDRITDRIGFRDIRATGGDILLNGEPVYLRGICVHEDDPLLGKTTDDADIRRRFEHARELGCNFLRLVHYPHHERVAEIADELGFMLWAEIPVCWAIDFANPDTYADAQNQLLELIARDRNRASVIVWGVGHETPDTDARYAFMRDLAHTARYADRSRLVSAACLIDRERFRIADRIAAHLDIVGLNEFFGWYEPDLSALERLLANSDPDKPVVISAFGADAMAGHHGDARELFTEECQAEIYRRQLEIIGRASYLRGLMPTLLYDVRSERRQNRFQRGFDRKGLMADDKATRKLAFDVLAAHFHALKAATP